MLVINSLGLIIDHRRCFRRLLRASTKNENSVFHPKNVKYHLVGNMNDLQLDFHLSNLHLPAETISVVTDTRYVFAPVTRLSKSKGKVEVVIKVGSQFVQVTTTEPQEVVSGMSFRTTLNDIFRLGEVDETTSAIQFEDDSSFGLRADGGKIVMFFTSSKKLDILQTFRGFKAKYGKDSRTQKSFERLIRPQDVPGTLLNLALTNLASSDEVLRLSSYNLLGAMCRAFKFTATERLLCSKGKSSCWAYHYCYLHLLSLFRDLSVPADPGRFIVNVSTELAREEPQLTSDFLTEFFVAWEGFPEEQKPLSLAYMAPWLAGLRTNVLAGEVDGEKGREKVAALFRRLIDLIVMDQNLAYALEQFVWPTIAQDQLLLDIFLDEVIKTALTYGTHEESLHAIASVAVGLGAITIHGKILCRLRKALNRSSLRPTRHLPNNTVWAEVCVLLQFCLSLSFNNGIQPQLFLPELFHVVTMLVNTGNHNVRLLVQRLLVNSVHAICTSFNLDDNRFTKLRSCLDLLCEPHGDIFASTKLDSETSSYLMPQDSDWNLLAIENLISVLFEICSLAATSIDMSNAWRSRWMSLVASTAFQNNPAMQPRAFAVMGFLAREEVDDDLLYQVLVALRNSVTNFGEDDDSEMLVSIIASLSKMITKLPSASRYGLQMFWLAISLLRLVPPSLFSYTAGFLNSVLTNIGTVGNVKGKNMALLLLQSRYQLDEAALPLDEVYGIHFSEENFHFAVCACLVRGLTDAGTRPAAIRVLSTFLEMSTTKILSENQGTERGAQSSPYLSLILARTVANDDFYDNLWMAGINPDEVSEAIGPHGRQNMDAVKDNSLLLMSVIELVDFQSLESSTQVRNLWWLDELAQRRPAVFLHL